MRYAAMAIALAITISLSGCIKYEQVLTIRKDGGVTSSIEWSMREQTITQLKSMRSLARELAAASGTELEEDEETRLIALLTDPTKETLQAELNRYQEAGITIDSLSVETESARRRVKIELSAKDIAALQSIRGFETYGFDLIRQSNGDYTLSRIASEKRLPSGVDLTDKETVRKLAPFLGGFDLTFQVKVPGVIASTSAPKKSLYTAIWRYAFDEDPVSFLAYQNHRMTVTFDGDDINLPTIRRLPQGL